MAQQVAVLCHLVGANASLPSSAALSCSSNRKHQLPKIRPSTHQGRERTWLSTRLTLGRVCQPWPLPLPPPSRLGQPWGAGSGDVTLGECLLEFTDF